MSHKHARRFLLAEEIATAQVQPWRFAVLGVPAPAAEEDRAPQAQEQAPAPANITPDDPRVQEWVARARAEGYARGQRDARAQTTAELEQHWQQRLHAYVCDADREAAGRLRCAEHLLQQLDAQVQQLRDQVAEEVLHLACDIARQVLRQELRGQPRALLGVVREALDLLAGEHRPARVRLHPDDLGTLQTLLEAQPNDTHPPVQWLADPGLHPGDAHIACAGTHIDASVQKRWQRAVAALGLIGSWYDPMASCATPA